MKSGLSGVLTLSVSPKGQDKKRAKRSMGEKSVTEPMQQHGELANDMVPTPVQRIKDHARNQKVRATQDWVEGRIDSKKHAMVHKRANHVLSGKRPEKYRGKTGEAAPKKGMIW